MPRLFVAFEIPDSLRQSLASLEVEHLAARRVAPENMHVTLRFIGDVGEEALDRVVPLLRAIDGMPFRTRATQLTAFPTPGRARVLAAALERPARLIELQKRIDDALVNSGLVELEERPYNPHVTFARLKSASSREVRSFLERAEQIDRESFDVRAFMLYESSLTSDGTRYRALERFVLDSDLRS